MKTNVILEWWARKLGQVSCKILSSPIFVGVCVTQVCVVDATSAKSTCMPLLSRPTLVPLIIALYIGLKMKLNHKHKQFPLVLWPLHCPSQQLLIWKYIYCTNLCSSKPAHPFHHFFFSPSKYCTAPTPLILDNYIYCGDFSGEHLVQMVLNLMSLLLLLSFCFG